ncbi:DAK2 domain-containing protein [Eubacterium xylanophilum]|uniref:DAK2 domain-containing protein n=1 Tax=Eubacterium xylanophilum TaxID=39497 RepID=UPI00047E8FBB|nr:DAK2 domain-containing protein [Eubacterium xylanophilum]
MATNVIDAAVVRKCFLSGAAALQAKKEYINELNVFPVPDGDTGTNMTMTIMSSVQSVKSIEEVKMYDICKAISGGALRGARGNSGVILSQLLRGFTKTLEKREEVDVLTLVDAFENAVNSAYKAVMKPKEGTILTVAKSGAEKAREIEDEHDDIIPFMEEVIEEMRNTLDQTPEMLPVLKEAGVVDSGGMGLLTVVEGAFDCLRGKKVDYKSVLNEAPGKKGVTPTKGGASKGAAKQGISTEDIKFGYCTEFIVLLEKEYTDKDEREFKAYLESIGDSIVCVSDDDIVKVHVHTNDPGLAFQKGLTYGQLTSMKVDNMREEHNEILINASETYKKEEKSEQAEETAEPAKEVGFISVSVGEGLSEIFKGLGCDYIIEGGQTMNPSTDDILGAIGKVNAKVIYILPNNSNIVLAANQAKDLTTDKEIVVVPTKNIAQGITAMINYAEGSSTEDNAASMLSAAQDIKSGQVTYAVRDTSIDGKEISSGDIMGLSDKTIEAVGKDIKETTVELIKRLIDDDSELITLYYGEEISEEEATDVASEIESSYEDVEVEVEYGGQPIYYYFVSIE